MDKHQNSHQSYLFPVRVWCEASGDSQVAWRGKVQHVLSGEAHYFRDWGTLVRHLLALLPDVGPDGPIEKK